MRSCSTGDSGGKLGGDFEYLELKNISDRELDLAGYHFTDGIEFRFTTNSAVRTLAPGAKSFGGAEPICLRSALPGVWATSLVSSPALWADEGERIALAGPDGGADLRGDLWR